MAKAKPDSATALASAASSVRPSPENTPVPGGGSWTWDDSKPGWTEVTPAHATEQATVEGAPQSTATE